MSGNKPVLKITTLKTAKRLGTSYKGEELTWGYSVWGKLNTVPTEEVFGPTNELLATLPEEKLDILWQCYKEAHDVLHGVIRMSVQEEELTRILSRMADVFDFDSVFQWASTEGRVYPDKSIDEVNRTRNPDETTYVRHDAHEMAVYCILVKLITPIWGPYINSVKEEVGTAHKERFASRIFVNSKFAEMRPFERLRVYLTALAESKANGPLKNVATMHGIPKADLDSLFMGLTLTRRFTIIPLRSNNKVPIVAFVFKFLEDKIQQLANGPYRDKFPTGQNNGQESDSYADQWRIAQDVSDMVVIEIEYYLENIPLLVQQLGLPDDSVEDVISLSNALRTNERFTANPKIHTIVPALILRKLISPAMHRHLARPARCTAIALAAMVCLHKGLDDVYRLLISVKQPIDIHEMTQSAQNGQQLRRLSKEVEQQLLDCYPHLQPAHIRNNTCPGRIAIEDIAKEINSAEWLGLGDASNIRQSLASLFINSSL
ncbi:hypothetical protein [Vibrio phage vB_VmeM-Yong XC32]|nr:hypothetical protein [Vibrio phage vB_VmeM-Yong XC31]QAX96359.1 hypothetical protein [Vibrio phage vB_VmeM-Yong XC32]QAX96677.1 hypothetical protein [Vibrio phage vB_VmeM-Yong MS31]QAX96995.1 hypothetical protein [Vibrio phage vB_VmeM-Yong MS32]